jgi:hypothetical protein
VSAVATTGTPGAPGAPGTARTARPVDTVLFEDDFRSGFHHEGPDARWQLRPVGGLPAGDGRVAWSAEGLAGVPTGPCDETGRPCFAEVPDPGPAAHLRWAALVARSSAHGFPGFDAVPGRVLVVEATLAAQAHGLDRHPYGNAVTDPRSDVRLAAAALITLDRESGVVFDLMLTDGAVHAVYERLPRPGVEGAVFSYAVPVGRRHRRQEHDCRIAYDPGAGRVAWWVDGREVLAVDRLGRRDLDAGFLLHDDGGPDEPAAPRQLAVGLGLLADQVWGQGLRLAARRVTVGTAPA